MLLFLLLLFIMITKICLTKIIIIIIIIIITIIIINYQWSSLTAAKQFDLKQVFINPSDNIKGYLS